MKDNEQQHIEGTAGGEGGGEAGGEGGGEAERDLAPPSPRRHCEHGRASGFAKTLFGRKPVVVVP